MRSHYLGALFAILMGFAETACGQIMLEVKFIGLSGHLRRNDNPHLYRLKLDKKGRLAGHIGLAFGIEYFLLENCLSVKFGQAFMLDCGFQPAGFTHLGLRLYATAGRHSFAIGNGPTFFIGATGVYCPIIVMRDYFVALATTSISFSGMPVKSSIIMASRKDPTFP